MAPPPIVRPGSEVPPNPEFHMLAAHHRKDGTGIRVTRRPGMIATTETPHEAVTLCLDEDGLLISVEVRASEKAPEDIAPIGVGPEGITFSKVKGDG